MVAMDLDNKHYIWKKWRSWLIQETQQSGASATGAVATFS